MSIKKIREQLKKAELDNNKTAMMHYLTLKHAEELINESPAELCKLLGLKKSMAAEIRKMRAVHILMKEKNLEI